MSRSQAWYATKRRRRGLRLAAAGLTLAAVLGTIAAARDGNIAFGVMSVIDAILAGICIGYAGMGRQVMDLRSDRDQLRYTIAELNDQRDLLRDQVRDLRG